MYAKINQILLSKHADYFMKRKYISHVRKKNCKSEKSGLALTFMRRIARGQGRDFGKNVFEERQQLGRREEKRRKRGGGSSLGVGLTKGACTYDVYTEVGGGFSKADRALVLY